MLGVNGFYGHIAKNNFRSLWMFAGFAVAFQLVAVVVLILPIAIFDLKNSIFYSPLNYIKTYGAFVLVTSITIFIYRSRQHLSDLQKELNFQSVNRLSEPRLYSIVEQIAVTAGIKMPGVAILPSTALNAFACGLSEDSAQVVVTSGLLNTLDDEELSTVIAHEITHIMNGDIRSMAFANVSIMSITRLSRFNFFGGDSWFKTILRVIFPLFFFLGYITGFFQKAGMTLARVTRLVIASSREYIADAEAVRLTHNPGALISALRKIEGVSAIDGLDPVADAMMIDGASVGEFATHPTIQERIDVLSKLSGAMAYESETRKDTRPASQRFGNAIGGFGRKVMAKPEPVSDDTPVARSLIGRVNTGSDTNTFGFSQKARKRAKIVAFGFVGLMMFASWNTTRQFAAVSNSTKSQKEIKTTLKSDHKKHKKNLRSEVVLHRLPASMKPVSVQKDAQAGKRAEKLAETADWTLR